MAENKCSSKKRQAWSEKAMEEALQNVKDKNMGWKLAAKTFNVPATTLRRRFKKNCSAVKGDLGGRRTVLSREIEQELASHIIEMETRFFGLTTKDLRRLVFQTAEKNKIKHNFNKEAEMAGKKWVNGFLKRNPRISLRIPENTSYARAQAFNKNNINSYFNALSAIIDQFNFPPENIYNVDESGLSTVQKRAQKIFATRGRKQVGTLSSAERGHHLTVVCAMNAIGTFVPPVFIFPRKRFKNELMDGAPPGSKAFCQDNGWMNSEIFSKWLQHFAHYTKASVENKVLLLLDGHSSHKSLEVLQMAKNTGIILFCFPAHCTHRVQPLDIGVFGPLQTYYNQEIQTWLKQNPGRTVTHFQVTSLFRNAYFKSATPSNAINAFAKAGIVPLNPEIFEDWMFAPSLTTDKTTEKQMSTTQSNEQLLEKPVDELQVVLESESVGCSTSIEKVKLSIQELSPLPTAAPKNESKRARKRGKCGHLNTTPDIMLLKEKADETARKERKRLAREVKRKIVTEEDIDHNKDDCDPYSNSNDDESDVACIYCNEPYSQSRAQESWIRCQSCLSWCHCDCAGVNKRTKSFICELCH